MNSEAIKAIQVVIPPHRHKRMEVRNSVSGVRGYTTYYVCAKCFKVMRPYKPKSALTKEG